MFSRHGHLDTVTVKVGDKVKKGQKIGTLGTGNGQWSGHEHCDFPKKELYPWTAYVFGMTKEQVKELYSDPKPFRPSWYDHMGWGYLELADYSGKKCYHPGEDWNGKGAGNADVGLPIDAPFDGEVVYSYAGTGKNGGWGKLVVIKESNLSTTIPESIKVTYATEPIESKEIAQETQKISEVTGDQKAPEKPVEVKIDANPVTVEPGIGEYVTFNDLTMKNIMSLFDFAPGYKTTAGAIVFVLGYFGHTVDLWSVVDALTATMTALGAVVSAYGLVMKVVRQAK